MKKYLLTIAIAVTSLVLNAQCIPDPQYTTPGIYPTALANALVGQPYNEVITIVTILDTSAVLSGLTIPVTITSVELTSVGGLPANFSYDCAAPNCTFTGGSTSCAVVYSTVDPVLADVGLYPLVMYTTTTADAGVFGVQTLNDSITTYYIDISSATAVVNQFNDFDFELKDAYPNPASDQLKIQFISGTSKSVQFSVFNLLGEEVESYTIAANKGVNDIDLNTSLYANGMYFYAINNGEKVISKRLVIAK